MSLALKKYVPAKTGRRSRRRVDGQKRVEWVLREVPCIAKPGAERETLELLFQQEVDRMRAVGKSEETIAEFQSAAAVQIALCDGIL
jgi:hypothetical protein